MERDADRPAGTRRDAIRYCGAVAGAGLLAGCSGTESTPSESGSGGGNGSADGNGSSGEGDSSGEDDDAGSYTASLAPVGEVEFDGVPENVFTMYNQYADMVVALGHGDAVNSMFVPEMGGPTMNNYYERLDGVSFDWKGLPNPYDNFTKEFFYDLDSDVHLLDPAWAVTQDNWGVDDVADVSESVGPFFGNFYSGTRSPPTEAYADAYEYYTLWEMFGRVADAFGERERYERLRSVHENLVASIRADLPPEDERPTAVRVTLGDGQFWAYHLNRPGFWLADTRPLAANDPFEDDVWDGLWGGVGYERMLEADPDVILHLWGATPRYEMASVRERLRSHSVGSELTAVQDDRVYAQGMRYQGPIMNLFQIEMTAKQLYPDVFGEWPGYEDGQPYPEIPADERLFDRDEVAAVVTGGAE